jgi:hypothetical protein
MKAVADMAVRILRALSYPIILFGVTGCLHKDRPQDPNELVLTGGSCDNCRLSLTPLVTLRPPNDTTDLFFDASVYLLPDSDWIAAPTSDGARIVRYTQDGRPRGIIGRRGQGPGEFGWIGAAVPSGSHDLTVFDAAQRRTSKISYDGRVYWTHTLGYSLESPPVPVTGGRFLLSTVLTTPDGFGLPIQIADSFGDIVHAFGDETVPDGALPGPLTTRLVRQRWDSTVWAISRANPVLENWTTDGRLIHLDTVVLRWFPLLPSKIAPMQETRPLPHIVDLIEPEHGLVLLLIQDEPRPGSASALLGSDGREGKPLSALSLTEAMRSRLVVFDTEHDAVLGSAWLPGLFGQFLPGPAVVQLLPDSLGATQLAVFRLGLVR